jgi:diguanylate cyclase (GGDEF)-like protein
MVAKTEPRRVLVAADTPQYATLGPLFTSPSLAGWQSVEADTFERARFLQQLDPCDVVLLDSSLTPADLHGLRWLTSQPQAPVLLLADADPESVRGYFELGVNDWLERRLALAHPPLLAAKLRQVVQLGDLQAHLRHRNEALLRCRRQVERLVGLLWQTVPVESHAGWFTQRHMMERLHEEVQRSQRHGPALSVILGELAESEQAAEGDERMRWAAGQLRQHKRRSDVAGQYGPHGFMLLLPHTGDQGAVQCCQRLQTILENPADQPVGVPVPVRFGIATYSATTATVETLLGRAEEGLEQARGTNPTSAP